MLTLAVLDTDLLATCPTTCTGTFGAGVGIGVPPANKAIESSTMGIGITHLATYGYRAGKDCFEMDQF